MKCITPTVAAPMTTKFQNVTIAPPALSASTAERPRQRTDERTEECDGDRHRGKLRLDQQRKRGRVADERSERADVNVGHDPGVLAPDDRELILEAGAGGRDVVHEEHRPEHRDDDRQEPHQTRVLQIGAANRHALIQIDDPEHHQDRGEKLHAAHADVAAGRVEPERPAFHPVREEE